MKDEKKETAPRGHGPGPVEKPKDFKTAITKLFHHLKPWRTLIYISLILAAVGSILSLVAPNRLSDLTNEIQKGIVVNTDNLSLITEHITEPLKDENVKETFSQILDMKFDQNTINQIFISDNITDEEKLNFQNFLSNNNLKEDFSSILQLPENILKIILPDSSYNDVIVTSQDKISLLNWTKNQEKTSFDELPESIQTILFPEFEIDGVKLNTKDQIKFLEKISESKEDYTKLYSSIDEMPDNLKTVLSPKMDMQKIKNIALFLAIIYIVSALFTYIESISMTYVSNIFAKYLRTNISEKINKLPLKYFDNHSTGDTLSRVTNDVDTIAQSMNQSLSSLVSAVTLFVGSIIMMFYTNWIMAITAILSSLIGFIFMFIILGKSQKYFTARQVELGKLNGHIEEVYSGLNVVKAYNGKKEADKTFDKYNQAVYECNRKSQFLSGLMMPMMSFIGNFSYVAVCIVGAILVVNGNTTFGVIVAFIMYVRMFTSPLGQIAQSMTNLQSTAAASERVFEFLEEKEMSDQKDIKKQLETAKGKIEFKSVSFGYDEDRIIIKDFSAIANPGDKIAIVGPTGAGKTTMVNLLMKFYEINKGDILIDGTSIKELSRENIHDLFIMVLQDTWLFNGTIRDNIKYNKENVTDEEIMEALKTVGIDHFVKSLPGGLDYEITDNDSISAGQKQLLTIARGMVKNASFLILDEATSSVDTRTEELVQKAMDQLTVGRTSFIIAHRLSTIKNADKILVMKDGNIIEQGNHEELMKQNGFYAELYNSQFQK